MIAMNKLDCEVIVMIGQAWWDVRAHSILSVGVDLHPMGAIPFAVMPEGSGNWVVCTRGIGAQGIRHC